MSYSELLIKVEYCRSAGLGNKLFPWARAVVLSHICGGNILEPVWFSPRGAGIIRGGIDYKKAIAKIWLLNNFRKMPGSVGLMSQLFSRRKAFLSAKNLDDALDIIKSSDGANILFRWNSFHDFRDLCFYRNVIRNSLMSITPKSTHEFISAYEGKKFIGVNIRCGNDFKESGSLGKGYFKTDIQWFSRALEKMRAELGMIPAIVVSDGTKHQLQEIISLPEVSFLDSRNALQDLLVLSKSLVLLGSGFSSFSAWASFLGGMDTYSFKNTPFDAFHINFCNTSQIIDVLA